MYRPPPIDKLLVLLFILLWPQVNLSAQRNPILGKNNSPHKTYTINHTSYREIDDIIAGISEMRVPAKGNSAEESATKYLEENLEKFGFNGRLSESFRHFFTWDGGNLKAVRFRQYYKGIPVDEHEIIITLNKSNEIISLLNYTQPIKKEIDIRPMITDKSALFATMCTFKLLQIPEKVSNEKIIHFIGDRFILCYRIRFNLDSPLGDWVSFVDAQTNLVFRQYNNLSTYQSGSGMVFNPDPISSSGATYGGNFTHNNDQFSPVLDAQRIAVTFPLGPSFAPQHLRGPNAYNAVEPDPCIDAPWNFTRDQNCFEFVNCYYHIDKSMVEYYGINGAQAPFQNVGLGVPLTTARYKVYAVSSLSAFYNSSEGFLYFSKFENGQGQTMDAAEDAAVIVHELGHGLNNWMTHNEASITEGLGEGFADYWSMSYTRNLGSWTPLEPQYHRCSNWFMFTDELPNAEDRTTNYVVPYPTGLTGDAHTDGQLFSTALMRIWDDIGKPKTDYIAIKGIASTGSGTNQWAAALAIFQAAEIAKEDGILSKSDLCIVYNHFKDIYGSFFDPTPPEGISDYFVRDTPADHGDEPNPDNGPMWQSDDIWVRTGDDDGIAVPIHENPIFGQPNFIYVRLRSRGCVALTEGDLRVYFSKAGTLLTWPDFWVNHFIQSPNGLVLAGDEIDNSPLSLPNNLRAGHETIITIPWTNMPDPGNFMFEKHHFCLLARIESAQDPMFTVETNDVGSNARNNNNIAWKNLSILGGSPGSPSGGGGIFGGTIFVNQSAPTPSPNSIHVSPGSILCQSQGDLFLRLRNDLHSLWLAQGSQGSGIALQTDGSLKIIATDAFVGGLAMTPGLPYYLTAEYRPGPLAQGCSFNVSQLNSLGDVVGGEQFVYDPNAPLPLLGEGGDRNGVSSNIQNLIPLNTFPAPATDLLNVAFHWPAGEDAGILILYDNRGTAQIRRKVSMLRGHNSLSLDISLLPKGVYYLRLLGANEQDLKIATTSFQKI